MKIGETGEVQVQYMIWIRPVGSNLWTPNMKPIYYSSRQDANLVARNLTSDGKTCAIVRKVIFPGKVDEGVNYFEIINERGITEQHKNEIKEL